MNSQNTGLLDIDMLAKLLGVSKSTIYRLRCYSPEKVPPAIKIGSHVRWRPSDVQAWLEKQSEVAA